VKPTPTLLILAFLMSGLGYAKEKESKNGLTLLIVKECEEKLCVQPLYPARIAVDVKKGEAPKKGQVLKCSRADNGDLLCEHGLRLKPDSILLQAQEDK
jgi:hypothetical protein